MSTVEETFLGWQRPQITERATGPLIHARRSADLLIDLTDDAGTEQGTAHFLLAGPQDVVSLSPAAVIGRKPAPGTQDAEVTRVAHVELADPDLPWRYSPDLNSRTGGVRPWMVLVVGETGSEVAVTGGNRVTLTAPVFAAHDLARCAGWAHTHAIPGRPISRILCPRTLAPGRDWTAALVPCWQVVSDELVPAWGAATSELTLPCFDSWRFWTVNEDDDFRAIAQRLEPLTMQERAALTASDFGRASVTVQGPDGRSTPGTVPLAGALGVIPTAAAAGLPAGVAARTRTLAEVRRHRGRWVLGLPRYDEPWTHTPEAGGGTGTSPLPAGWRRQLHEDPRHRGVAGLGAWAGIVWQDRIAAGATAQAGALAVLAERVRHLSLGLRATRSQWTRRVPADPLAALSVLGPMLGALPTSERSTALDDMSRRTPWLVPGLFSSAARRILRPRAALARAAAPGTTRHAMLVEVAATTCPPAPELLPGQRDLPELLADPDAVASAAHQLAQEGPAVLERLYAAMDQQEGHEQGFDLDALSEALREVDGVEVFGRLAGRPGQDHCAPISDLGQVAESVRSAIDPTVERPVVVARVLDGVLGVRAPELAPPDLALELDIPLWSFLRDASPDWLLPGAGAVPPDRVLALQTNPEFVDAFLMGANQQTLGELRWRNLPIVAGWTPLRRFWQRISDDCTATETDIRPVLDISTPPVPGAPVWTDASVLGDAAHQRGAPAAMLVVLLHTELFRRYPATQAYLMATLPGATPWTTTPDPDGPLDPVHPERNRIHPNLTGSLEEELVFFGFPMPPEAAQTHWLVLEEPPPGLRFKVPSGVGSTTDGGTYAAKTLNRPVRAFFGNLL